MENSVHTDMLLSDRPPDDQIVTEPVTPATTRHEKRRTTQNFALVILGVLICLINMGLAWRLIESSNHFVMTGLVADKNTSATNEALKQAATADANKLLFLNKVIENDVNHRNIANKQTAVIVAMAASFSLIAIGFALFVMGVEAAYTISGKNATASLVVGASSPGLLCFLLAAVVIGVAITRQTSVTFAPLDLTDNPHQAVENNGSVPIPSITPVKLGPTYEESKQR